MIKTKLIKVCMGMCILITAASVCGCGNKNSNREKASEETAIITDCTSDEETDENYGEKTTEETAEENSEETAAGDLTETEDVTSAGNEGDAAATDTAWKDAYMEKLSEISNGNIDDVLPYYGLEPSGEEYEQLANFAGSNDYYLYDIDGDDVPELIVKYGTCEADYRGFVYKYKNNQAEIFCDFGLGHRSLYSDPERGGIIIQQAHMGYNFIYRMNYAGCDFEIENLFEEDGIESSDEYTEPGEVVSGSEYLPCATVGDDILIKEYSID